MWAGVIPHTDSAPQQRAGGKPFVPMQVLNGLVIPKADRQAPSCDYDETPVQFRRQMGDVSGVSNVQLRNGLRNRIASGYRFVFPGAGFLFTVQPRIPGQTRGNYGGFVPRGPSPYNVTDIFENGPGSQPAHPGGPARIAAQSYVNPMTG